MTSSVHEESGDGLNLDMLTFTYWLLCFPYSTRSGLVKKNNHVRAGSQVLLMLASPNMEAKPQLSSLRVGSWLFYAKIFTELVLKVGSNFLLDTSPEPHLQKVLSCRHPCHTWNLGLGTPMWSGKSQLPCSQRLRLQWLTSSDLGLGTHVNRAYLNTWNSCYTYHIPIINTTLKPRTFYNKWDNWQPYVIHNPHNQT